jgi:hypothetical protein
MAQISTGVMCEWYDDDSVVAYTVTSLNDKILAEWSQSVVQLLTNWSEERDRFNMLVDLSHPRMSLLFMMLLNSRVTPGLTVKGQEYVNRILAERPMLHISMALVIPSSESGTVTAARCQLCNLSNIDIKMFFSHEDALEWLEEEHPAVCDG